MTTTAMLDKTALAAAREAATEAAADGGVPVDRYIETIVAAYLSHAAGDVAGLVENAMEQAQVFASSYSLVGGRFDDGSQMQQAEDAKQELRDMIATTLLALSAENAGMKAERDKSDDERVEILRKGTAWRARAEAAEARMKEMEAALAAEEKRSAELLRQLDKARGGNEPDFCYDPEEWEFTCDWDERDQVHGHGENLALGDVMQVATLIRGPRKWVANVPVAWDEYGDPEDFEIKWFDSDADADAARSLSPIKEAGNNG